MHRRGPRAIRSVDPKTSKDSHAKAWKHGDQGPQQVLLVAFLGSVLVLMGVIWNLPNEPSGDAAHYASHSHNSIAVSPSTSSATDRNDADRHTTPPHVRNGDNDDYHMVFSTGCSIFQDWQSYLFFFHTMKVDQPGHVTRIVSGCSNDDEKQLQQLFDEQIAPMSDKYHLHFTPDYSKISNGFNFKYYNKPFGMQHWMEHGMGYPNNTDHDDAVVILMDPDQILLRPITRDFRNSTILWKRTANKQPPKLTVEHGSPFGQLYGFGAQWMTKVDPIHVANGRTPVQNVSMSEARDSYSLGPPYIATARDMYKIVSKWAEFVPRVHDDYPHLLAEMFGYCFSAAHQGLRHQTALSFMVSDPYAGIEGWGLVEQMGRHKVCQRPPRDHLPYLLHYCQRYMLGKWYIGKYRLPKNFISCDAPMLMEPPEDIGLRYNFAIGPGSTEKKPFPQPHHITRMAFMLCHLIPALNEAAEYFKHHNCPADKANFEKTLTFHPSMEIE